MVKQLKFCSKYSTYIEINDLLISPQDSCSISEIGPGLINEKIRSIITHTEFCLIHDYYVVRRGTESSGTALHKLKSQESNSHLRS